jgi:SAM-dependent methyltransferase
MKRGPRSSCMKENVGTGPGVITNDGCAVDFYALLPAFGEPEIVHAAIPAGASILELGCGTGRLLRPLAALGHPVLGADDSADMLAHVPDLPTVRSSIETLRLDRTFDVVMLASNMINADPVTRQAFLATVRDHLSDGGAAVFQQEPPSRFQAQEPPERTEAGGIRILLRSPRWEPPRFSATVEYQVGDRVWTHSFTSYQVSEQELASDLASAGLVFGEWLTGNQVWFTARRS